MKNNLKVYFWDLHADSLKEVKRVLSNPWHPMFLARATSLLSRCDKPKEAFTVITKKIFLNSWPKINRYWAQTRQNPDFRTWWQTIYEQLSPIKQKPIRKNLGKPPRILLKIGSLIRQERLKAGMSQKQLALKIGIKQPVISKIEEGQKNITLATLDKFNKVLGLRNIPLN